MCPPCGLLAYSKNKDDFQADGMMAIRVTGLSLSHLLIPCASCLIRTLDCGGVEAA